MSTLIDNMDTAQLILLANTIAIALSEGLTATEINILGNVVSSAGDLMQLIAARKEIIENASKSNSDA